MQHVSLFQLVWLLAAAAIAAPLAKWLRIGSVLGYLLAGALIGPFGVGQIFTTYSALELREQSEFGVVLLLFLIGLELRPRRLLTMRNAIFGLGGLQVGISAAILAILGILAGVYVATALFVGLALSLSSTAFALQILEENGELTSRHGRLAFAMLLFQDLAAIPLIALVPLFVVGHTDAAAAMGFGSAAKAIGTIVLVVVVGRFLLDGIFRVIARTKVREAMTAAALLTVVGASAIMASAGLSPSLGAFLAGALLSESSYRHQLEADIQPFQGLLLGLFFTAVGMSLDFKLIPIEPFLIAALVVGLIVIKTGVLYGIGRWHELEPWAARRLGLSLSQGGEFAFVLFTSGVAVGVLPQAQGNILSLAVTLTMALTPLLLLADEMLTPRAAAAVRDFAPPPDKSGHVIIAGFGRFGQIAARILAARRIPFTALDINPEQLALVERYGSKAFYGDASRLEILDAAQAGKARALLVAIDDVEASLRTVQIAREHYPDLRIYARARDRRHLHRLMDLGVPEIRRE
ncbi:MAG: monovalent cation:proton antiporter-2 (CPA2) family protein, partial [Hyphomicrobiaceae bacterium]